MKAPLAIVLAATQLFASSASSLYLCLSADGSACVDFGPETCCCCQHGHEHADTRMTDHDACCDHQPSHDATLSLDDPCGCKHVQISEPQNVTRNADADRPSCVRHDLSLIAIPCPTIVPPSVAAGVNCRPLLCWLYAPPPALSLLATVIIRC